METVSKEATVGVARLILRDSREMQEVQRHCAMILWSASNLNLPSYAR